MKDANLKHQSVTMATYAAHVEALLSLANSLVDVSDIIAFIKIAFD